MRSAVLFDLDGTLVQTESLKAESYARAAAALRPGVISEEAVIDAYDQCIGRPRDEVAQTLLDRFGLADAARQRMQELGADSPRAAFVAIRLRLYEQLLQDRELIRSHELPAATSLLRHLAHDGYSLALTTVSHAAQAFLVLDTLAIRDEFDAIVTVDDVARGKPAPDLYLLAMSRLGMPAERCVAIEDSVPGIEAALAAGVICVASTNPLTRTAVDAMPADPRVTVVDDPAQLERAVRALLIRPEEATAWS